MRAITLIYNPASGTLLELAAEDDLPVYFKSLLAAFPEVQLTLVAFKGDQLNQLKRDLKRTPPDAVWVAGGDGTVLAVASLTESLNIPLGVLPGGTMNLLARDIGMSLTMKMAVRQLIYAEVEYIDRAEINGRPFLCISNFGMSTKLTERRERLRRHSGWVRWPMMLGYMLKFMFIYPPIHIRLEENGKVHQLRTRAVTVTNNPLAAESTIIPMRCALNQGVLGVYVTRDRSIWSLPRLIFRLLIGDWQGDEDMLIFKASAVKVSFRRRKRKLKTMSDGELFRDKVPLKYRIYSRVLPILKPGVIP